MMVKNVLIIKNIYYVFVNGKMIVLCIFVIFNFNDLLEDVEEFVCLFDCLDIC